MSAPPADAPRIIEITVKNVMAGKPTVKVNVPLTCTVRGLKLVIAERCDVMPDRQLLLFNDRELKDDDARLGDIGMTQNCVVNLSVFMNTGAEKPPSAGGSSSLIFYVPISLPNGPGLRNSVRLMTTVKGRSKQKKIEKTEENAQIWTPEKRLEIELTRNRMKSLMKKKKKTNILSPATGTPVDSGSVIGSRGHSPLQTPPNELVTGVKRSPVGSRSHEGSADEIAEITDRELKLFFEPMETMDQLERLKRTKAMAPPPQNEQELVQLKQHLEMVEKTCCKMCGKKLPMAEQAMLCKCKKLFCKNHRDPQDHMCRIDYKHTGRARILKENPRVGEGGLRKGKL